MKNILYIIAAVLIVVWTVGFLTFSMGGFIHILLLLGILLVAYKVNQEKRN